MREEGNKVTRVKRRGASGNSNAARWLAAWLGSAIVTQTLLALVARRINPVGGVWGACEFSGVMLMNAAFIKVAHTFWHKSTRGRATIPLDILILIGLLCATLGAAIMIGLYLLPFGLLGSSKP